MGDKGYPGLRGFAVVIVLSGLLIVPIASAEVRYDVAYVDGADASIGTGTGPAVVYSRAEANAITTNEDANGYCTIETEAEAAAGPLAGTVDDEGRANLYFYAYARAASLEDEDSATFPFTAHAYKGATSYNVQPGDSRSAEAYSKSYGIDETFTEAWTGLVKAWC